jgi:2-polyprenyl-3-methyl-5-hydroxy-6-metoxy-1,4-benzoquinol methylase
MDAKTVRFWNRTADGYAKKPVPDEAAYRHKLEMTRALFRPGDRMLEFGCGTGTTAIHHAPHVGHIDALDLSERMIGIGREKADAAGVGNIDFHCAPVSDFAADAASYDAVLGMSVLHLLPDWRETIAQVHGLLKPGGVFVSSTMCLNDGFGFMKYLLPLGQVIGKLPVVAFFSRAEFLDHIARTGFTVETDWQPKKRSPVFLIARKPA